MINYQEQFDKVVEAKDLEAKKEELQNAIFKECKVFFAFGEDQLRENKAKAGILDGENIAPWMGGGFCLADKRKALCEGLDKLIDAYSAARVRLNGLDSVILYELRNHECFYTGDYRDAYDALEHYKEVTLEEVERVYYENRHNYMD